MVLAADAIEAFVSWQRIIEPPSRLFVEMPDALMPAGAFVCLKLQGRLRGCIGTTEPIRETLADEVIENAISAATRDPRFPRVQSDELTELCVSVDVLSPSEPVTDLDELDHRRYGIILRSGDRRSVLLPDIEGINSVQEQVSAAREKAGLRPHDQIELLRFEVRRYR